MLTLRLVNLIEKHAEQLTEGVVHELRTDPRTPSYHKLAPHEDYNRVYTVVHNLGTWLDRNSDIAAENAYRGLGKTRFSEGIPLAEVVCALMLTKQTIRRFIQAEGWMDSALDLCQQVELYNLISYFFERATYFTVASYEAEARSAWKTTVPIEPNKRRLTTGWGLRKSPSVV
jgi:hypothetical protein